MSESPSLTLSTSEEIKHPSTPVIARSHSIIIGDDENQEDENALEMEEKIIPPDGGWAWIIVAAAFFINSITDGIIYSFGVLVNPIMEWANQPDSNNKTVAEVSIGEVSWVGSICSGCYLLGGPIVAYVANKYGFRILTFIGSIVSAVGFLLTWMVFYFQKKPILGILFIFYGVIGGFGCGMVSVPAQIGVGFYFDKKRALASGIAVCGSGVGTFILPPVMEIIIEAFNWQAVLIFQTVLILICGLIGLFYIPIKPTLVPKGKFHQAITKSSFMSTGGIVFLSKVNTARKKSVNDSTHSGADEKSVHSAQEELPKKGSSSATIKSQLSLSTGSGTDTPTHVDHSDHGDHSYQPRPRRLSIVSQLSRNYILDEPLDEIDEEEDFKPALVFPISTSSNCLGKCCQIFFDFSLLKSPSFQLLSLASFFFCFGIFIPFTFLKAMVSDKIHLDSSSATFLISVIGIGNTVGRLVCGSIGDRPWVNSLIFNNAGLTVLGLSVIVLPFLNKHWQFIVCTTVLGLSMGVTITLRSIVLIKLLALDKLTSAFGLTLLMYGTGTLLGLPFGGFLHDLTSGYTVPFVVAGGCITLSGVLCYPLFHVKRWEEAREKKAQSDDSKSSLD